MISALLACTIAAVHGAGVGVSVVLLDGKAVEGTSATFAGPELRVHGRAGRTVLPMNEVLEIDFAAGEPSKPPNFATVAVLATDGSLWRCAGLVLEGRVATIRLSPHEAFVLPASCLSAVAYNSSEAGLGEWQKAARRRRLADVLSIVRETGRAEVEGVISRLGPESIGFVVDDQEVKVPLSRVAAAYFRQRAIEPAGQAIVVDRAGNHWTAGELRLGEEHCELETPSGVRRRLALGELRRIDFTPGRLAFLSDLEPAVVAHTPFFDVPWPYRKDSNFASRPLSIGGVVFPRGLCVHSKTVLEYDLSGRFRRFEATVGIDDSAGPLGDAPVRIVGDERTIWSGTVRAGSPPSAVSVDVRGMGRLVIEVEFGNLLDLGDHVVLGNARLVR